MNLDGVFAEGLKDPECVLILENCLRSLEQQLLIQLNRLAKAKLKVN